VLCVVRAGSGEGHTAYFYRRVNVPPKKPVAGANVEVIDIPKRSGESGDAEAVFSDRCWAQDIRLAVTDKLRDVVTDLYLGNMHTARPVRERKPNRALFV
jgi:hypothetical protein